MKVKVKVAVCMGTDGNYSTAGWTYKTKEDLQELLHLSQEYMDFPLINKTFWLTAEVDAPEEPGEIQGEVEEIS